MKGYRLELEGGARYQKRDWDGAIRDYREALRYWPTSENRRNLALAETAKLADEAYEAVRAGHLEEALSEYQAARAKVPDRNAKKQLAGLIAQVNAQIAAKNAAMIANVNAIEAGKLNEQGKAAYEKEDLKTAIAYFRQASQLAPNNKSIERNLRLAEAGLSFNTGYELWEKKDNRGALRYFEEAEKYNPDPDFSKYRKYIEYAKENIASREGRP